MRREAAASFWSLNLLGEPGAQQTRQEETWKPQTSTSFPLNLATGSSPKAALNHAQAAEGMIPLAGVLAPPYLQDMRGTVFPSLSGSPRKGGAFLGSSTSAPNRFLATPP